MLQSANLLVSHFQPHAMIVFNNGHPLPASPIDLRRQKKARYYNTSAQTARFLSARFPHADI